MASEFFEGAFSRGLHASVAQREIPAVHQFNARKCRAAGGYRPGRNSFHGIRCVGLMPEDMSTNRTMDLTDSYIGDQQMGQITPAQ
jgi:hypothetical protein